MSTSQNDIVRLSTGNIGIIRECNSDSDKYEIRVFTPLFEDYQVITLSSAQFDAILAITTNSKIHNYGLSTLLNIRKFNVIFEEPILIPFAPIIDMNDKTIASKIIKWWSDIKQLSNENKFNVFMCLSHHERGPIVKNVDQYLTENRIELINTLKNGKNELNELRKALLIDGANTFDEGSYELICRINHCCDPNCFVTRDGKVKSLRNINKNEELTWNFSNDKYLYLCTEIRIKQLFEVWGFVCNCFRCKSYFDDARIFKCIKCAKASIYVTYNVQFIDKENDGLNITTQFNDCFECKYELQPHEIEYYLSMENRMNGIIDLMSTNETETEFEQTLEHLKQYLSETHYKWFQLWNAMIFQFNNHDNNNNKIFGKTLKYSLLKCYQTMHKMYSKSMNFCLYQIEWKLLNCIVDQFGREINSIAKCICDKSERLLVNKLYKSIHGTKGMTTIDAMLWQKITHIVNLINECKDK